MKNITKIIIVLLSIFANSIIGQNRLMDSLNLALKNAKHDSTKLNISLKLCELCEIKDNLKYGLLTSSIADKLILQSKNNSDKEYFISKKLIAYNIIGVYYSEFGKKDSLEYYQLKSIALAKTTSNKELINTQIDNLAEMYRRENQYTKAMKIYTDELKIAERAQDKKAMIFNYIGISDTYSRMHNNQKSLEYRLKELKIEEENGDKTSIAWANLAVGQKYYNLYNYNSALEYYHKAEDFLLNKIDDRQKIYIFFSIARPYNELKNFKEARNYFFKALEINKNLHRYPGDSVVRGVFHSEIGQTYFYEKNYAKALEYKLQGIALINSKSDGDAFTPHLTIAEVYLALKQCDLAEKNILIAKKIAENRKDLHNQKAIAKALHDVYKAKGNNSKSNEYLIQFYELKDSLDKVANKEELLYKEMNYENEKNELKLKAEQDIKDKSAKEEKQQQQLIIITVALILLIVIIFLAILFKRFRLTNKQKAIIEQQKHLVEEKHKEITDSINYAERIQRSFIATKEILDENLNDYFVLFKPKDVVSGDFYWADTLLNGNFVLVTADSTGHGVPGSIMSLLNITSLEKAVEHLTNPAEILNHTRKTIIERLKKDGSAEGGKDGMDASLTVYDFANNKLIIAAANNPVWIVRGTETIEIKPDKMPIGKHDKDSVSFTQQEFDLQKGDVIYTLTDGFPDQFGGEKGKKFMSKNLREFLATNAHLPMHEQKQLLEKTFSDWIGDLEQVDDVTVIGIRI